MKIFKQEYEKQQKLRKILSHIRKMKSSISNRYCLYCRCEINENHYCKGMEFISDEIIKNYLELDDDDRKEIVNELKNEVKEFAQNIKNKILAYSL